MEEPVVTIEQGRLKGKTGADYDGNKYYSFQGIPYAKPPLGKLRFRVSNRLHLRDLLIKPSYYQTISR